METVYYVLGHITFHGYVGKQHDPEMLLRLVQGVENAYPWRVNVNGKLVRSESRFKIGERREGDSRCTIKFHPEVHMLSGRQVDAYRNYVDTIARELAELKLENVIGISSSATFDYLGRTYETPFARAERASKKV